MSTPAQIAANRANSQHSTAPTTDTGKQTVSRNALKFGLSSKVHIALPGEENALEKHVEGYIEGYAPVGLPERDLVRNIAENHFRLQRAHGLEHALFMQLMSEQPDNIDPASTEAEIWEQKARELKNVSREACRIQRAIEKSTAALNAMQAQRKSAYAKAEAEAILLTQLAHAKGQTVDAAKDFPSPEQCGGFVYALPEIARLIGRAARLAEANARFMSAADVLVCALVLRNPVPAAPKRPEVTLFLGVLGDFAREMLSLAQVGCRHPSPKGVRSHGPQILDNLTTDFRSGAHSVSAGSHLCGKPSRRGRPSRLPS